MIDWTKPIFAKMTTNLIPAKFIGFRSNGQAIVECFDKIHTEVDPETGQIGFLKFINKPKYKYVPFDSYEEVIPFIGKRVCRCGSSCEITGILIHCDGIGLQLVSSMGYTSIEDLQYMCEKYVFENTNEPVGKKVEV